MANCPLRVERKEKGFAGKEDSDSSDDGMSARYQRKQRAYLAIQQHSKTLDESDSDEGEPTQDKEVLANFGIACRGCEQSFLSGNKLHSHLKSFNGHIADNATTITSNAAAVIDLTDQPKGEYLEGIANCTETRAKAYIAADSTSYFTAIIDSGFGRSAVNRQLLDDVPHTIRPIQRLVIRGIGGRQAVMEMAEFVFYLHSTKGALLKLNIKALIFDDLRADLLISTDYIRAWNIILDLPRQLATFSYSNTNKLLAAVSLQVIRQPSANMVVRVIKDAVIAAGSLGQVPIRLNYQGKADLLFTSAIAEVPDGILSAAQRTMGYLNEGSKPVTIKRGRILGTASAITNGNFALSTIATEALNGFLGLNGGEKAEKARDAVVNDLKWLGEEYLPKYQYELPDGVAVPDISSSTYRDIQVNDKLPIDQQKQLRMLAKRFTVLFSDSPGLARQAEHEWLRIKVPLELERKLKPRPPYRNAPRAKQAINETFDENTRLSRMGPAAHSPYSLLIFVVYKYTPEGAVKKARLVVDLRPLNDIAESDAYPLPLQEDILAALAYAD
jgi:hypothetical protein